MQISPSPTSILEFPRTPAAPVAMPWTHIRITEGIGAPAKPTTQVVQDLFSTGAPDHVEMSTFHRGRLLANTELSIPVSPDVSYARSGIAGALLGSAALERGIDASYRQVVLRDTMVVKWTGSDGRTLATRVPLDATSGRALDPQDAELVDAIRDWQRTAGITDAVAGQVAATASMRGHNS